MTAPAPIVIERTYPASVDEVWALWTTPEGFASWWGPVGFRVEVHTLDARVGGALDYDMIADAPEQIAAMQAMGQPTSHGTHGKFSELEPKRRVVLTHMMDFLPGVQPYESTLVVELTPVPEGVRMIVTLHPLHSPEFSQMQREGFTSQLTKLDQRAWSR